MYELNTLIKKFIYEQQLNLIDQLCSNETTLIGKKEELINKYVINLDNDLDNDLELHNQTQINLDNDLELHNQTPIDIEMSSDTDENSQNEINNFNNYIISNEINNLSQNLDKLSLKELQKICQSKIIDIYKVSESSGRKVKKTRKELLDLIN